MPNYRTPDPAAATNAFARQVQLGSTMRANDQAEEMNALQLDQMRKAAAPQYDAQAFQRVGGIATQIASLTDPVQKREAFKAAILGNGPAFDALGMPHTEALVKIDSLDDAGLDATLAALAQHAPRAKPTELAAGASLVSSRPDGTYAADFTAPSKPAGEADGFTLSPGQQRFGPDGKPIARVAPAPDTADEQQVFSRANALRDEYEKKQTNYGELLNSFETIKTLGTNASPAGDIAMVAAFMRAVDPGSRVTGAEQATAENSGGVPAVIRSTYNKLLGNGQLSASQRADFMAQAENLVEGRKRGYVTNRTKYEGLAKRAGVNPIDVIGDEVTISGSTRPPQAAPPGGAVPTATGPNGQKLFLRNGQWVPQ